MIKVMLGLQNWGWHGHQASDGWSPIATLGG